jgi:MFS family permease
VSVAVLASDASAWSPLRRDEFRRFWIASLVSNVGTWAHTTAAAWLMATLSPSPLLVSLMQTAASLPFFVLALPAGALADVVDRRRLLLLTQYWMVIAAAALGAAAAAHVVTPWTLLALTCALGIGAALSAPAWQAITPELVPPEELPAAVTLGAVAMNVARAVGPALGGVLAAVTGTAAVFLLNAASFVGVAFVVHRWHRPVAESQIPPEHMLGAMQAGARYVAHAPLLRAVLVRTAAFILPAAGLWALLPVVARSLGFGAVGYGALLACLGVGAIAGAVVLPRVRRRLGVDALCVAATLVFAASALALAVPHRELLAPPALLAGGVAWMAIMSSVNVAAQRAVPGWVRARALALSLLAIQGGLATGGVVWGVVADRGGVALALAASAAALVVGLAATWRFPLAAIDGLDLTPSLHWPEPQVSGDPDPDRGPVLVTIEYRVAPGDEQAFAAAMRGIERLRRRDGALQWGLFQDAADPARHVETFLVASWADHLRQHERITIADQEVERAARRFHTGAAPPRVTHLWSAFGRR